MKYKLSQENKIVIASHNPGKVKEISELFSPYDIIPISAKSLDLLEPEEDGTSFSENALIKARSASKLSKIVSISDDSGLCVRALNDEPGIFSARWAGPKKNFRKAIKKIEEKIKEKNDLHAYFVCGLGLVWPDGYEEYYEGTIQGTLKFPPTGNNGFGYDPIFCPIGYDLTFGQLPNDQKEKISHRSIAFKKLQSVHFF